MILTLPDSTVIEAAQKAFAVMEDRDRYTLDEVCAAVILYAPVILRQLLEGIDDFTCGEEQMRAQEFNWALGQVAG